MSSQEIRSAFEEMCGSQRYEEFLRAFQSKSCVRGRLLYWQEELWTRFCASHPEALRGGFDFLLSLFNICPVHRLELQRDRVPFVYGTFIRNDAHEKIEERYFPCARLVEYGGSCLREVEDPGAVDVDYCAHCRANHSAWKSGSWKTEGFPFPSVRSQHA